MELEKNIVGEVEVLGVIFKLQEKYVYKNTKSLGGVQKWPSEVFYKKELFLEISQYSQETTCAVVSF